MSPAPGDLGCFDAAYAARVGSQVWRAMRRWFRAEVRGLDRVPAGAFLGVGNHSGATLIPDTLAWLAAWHRGPVARAPLLALAHDAMFDEYPAALAHRLARLGAIRARNDLALAALAAGNAVQVYPGGDHDACRPFRHRHQLVFAGRTGYVRLAQAARVPIVPVAAVGAHEALIILAEGRRFARWTGVDRRWRLTSLPLSWSLPWGLWLGPLPGYLPLPTKIIVQALDPVDPSGSVAVVDHEVRARLQTAINELARGRKLWMG